MTPPTTTRRRGHERTTEELTAELDVLKQVNSELLDVLTSLSLKYWVDRLQQAERQIARLGSDNIALTSKLAKVEERLDKAARTVAQLQRDKPCPPTTANPAMDARSTESNRGRSAPQKPTTTTAPRPATGSASPPAGQTGASR